MSRVVAIISGKGGVGKTTIAVNLAAALTKLGESVILVDANLLTPNVSIHLGIHNMPYTLTDVFSKKVKLKTAIFTHDSDVKVLPAGLSVSDQKQANFWKLSNVFKELRKMANVIIVDSPPSITAEVQEVVKNCDEALIVTNPELPAVSDAVKALNMVKSLDKKITGIIVNKKNFEEDIELSVPEIESILDHSITASVPTSRAVKESLSKSMPVIFYSPKCPASVQINKLAYWLIGKEYALEPNKKGFWSWLFKK